MAITGRLDGDCPRWVKLCWLGGLLQGLNEEGGLKIAQGRLRCREEQWGSTARLLALG